MCNPLDVVSPLRIFMTRHYTNVTLSFNAFNSVYIYKEKLVVKRCHTLMKRVSTLDKLTGTTLKCGRKMSRLLPTLRHGNNIHNKPADITNIHVHDSGKFTEMLNSQTHNISKVLLFNIIHDRPSCFSQNGGPKECPFWRQANI